MNERIKEIADEAFKGLGTNPVYATAMIYASKELEKFAELIVEECRTVVTEVYRNTPLELCGPLLAADEKIAKHFYGVEE
jgi:hypothetical protein